jgi:proline iminopeptidase
MSAHLQSSRPAPRDGYLPVDDAELYWREIGRGQPVVILHGGPDFDHSYLLPDMDRLSDSCRLIYYDQRGRGRSARNVQPDAVDIQSEMDDLERLRDHFHLESVALLGHSWGGLLALEYAVRHPNRVSHLILMNTAPASHDDYVLFRRDRRSRAAGDLDRMEALSASAKYQAGDPDTVAAYYRIHFSTALRRPEHVDHMVERLRSSFTRDGILKARAIEERLMTETWLSGSYDLLPELERLSVPTLVIHGDHDFIPVECALRIARAIPGARFVLLSDCGHFSYLECPDDVRREIDAFLHSE